MLTMLCTYLSDPRVGDGFRTGFLLKEGKGSAVLYLPSELATVSVPTASLTKAKTIAYRPRVVRGHMLRRTRLYRRYGHRFPRKATNRHVKREAGLVRKGLIHKAQSLSFQAGTSASDLSRTPGSG